MQMGYRGYTDIKRLREGGREGVVGGECGEQHGIHRGDGVVGTGDETCAVRVRVRRDGTDGVRKVLLERNVKP
jgi:hypothetical protein